MKAIKIKHEDQTVSSGHIPEAWTDIQPEKRRQVLRIAVTLPYPHNFHNILIQYMGLPQRTIRQVKPEALQALYDQMQWIVTDPVTTPIFSSFRHYFTQYHFPKPTMENATGLEYALADEYYTKFAKEQDEKSLLLLAATLIRPADKKKRGLERKEDPRIKLESRTQVEMASEKFEKFPAEVIHSAFLYFTGVKNWIHSTYGQYIFEESETQKKDTFGWYGVFFSLSETGSFGEVDDVAQQNFHTICQFLMKRKMDEPKPKPKMQ